MRYVTSLMAAAMTINSVQDLVRVLDGDVLWYRLDRKTLDVA